LSSEADESLVVDSESPRLGESTKPGGIMSVTTSSFGTVSSAGKAIIGRTVVIKGEIQSREALTIEGEVEGTIEISEHLLTVAQGGAVRAHINAHDLDVLGRVEGEVKAVDKVYLRKGAEFVGVIHAASLVVEEGGYIQGNIDLAR
jgi:cytoskeletal protein CcmA (bactofilin family)